MSVTLSSILTQLLQLIVSLFTSYNNKQNEVNTNTKLGEQIAINKGLEKAREGSAYSKEQLLLRNSDPFDGLLNLYKNERSREAGKAS